MWPVAQAAVDVARTQVSSAEAARDSARTNLARVKRGATKEEIAIAEHRIEVAKNALWGAQGQRDAICGRKSSVARLATAMLPRPPYSKVRNRYTSPNCSSSRSRALHDARMLPRRRPRSTRPRDA